MNTLKTVIFGIMLTSLLTACSAQENHDNTVENERPSQNVTATAAPTHGSMRDDTGNIIDDAGNVVEDVGDAAGNVVKDAGKAVDDAANAVGDAASGR